MSRVMLTTLLLLAGCTGTSNDPTPAKTPDSEPTPVATKPAPEPSATPEPTTPAGRRCFFEGDLSSLVRTSSARDADGFELNLAWDEGMAAGMDWVEPNEVGAVEMPWGLECSESYDVLPGNDIEVSITGDREMKVRIPASFVASLGKSCPKRELELGLAFYAMKYPQPCEDSRSGEGEHYDVVALELTLPAKGNATINAVRASGGTTR